MKFSATFAALTFSAALIAPAQSLASEHVTLTFLGVASPGIDESINAYDANAVVPPGGHFDGPVSIKVSIADFDTTPYVDHFSIDWADAPSGPYAAGWQGAGSPGSVDPFTPTYLSNVALNGAGGSISIFNNFGYAAFYDGAFSLNLDFAFDAPQTFLASFQDGLASGGGAVSGSKSLSYAPGVGFFDSTLGGGFTLSRVEAVVSSVPEPGAWAMMIVGFFGLGAVLRRQRAAAA